MSIENVKKFYEVITQDESIKQKLIELSPKHQGETMDEAKSKLLLEQEILTLATKMGYSFSLEEWKQFGAMTKQLHDECELSDEEMQTVSGGSHMDCNESIGVEVPDTPEEFCQLYHIS